MAGAIFSNAAILLRLHLFPVSCGLRYAWPAYFPVNKIFRTCAMGDFLQ